MLKATNIEELRKKEYILLSKSHVGLSTGRMKI